MLRHVKGRRGGDLVGVLLVGSGARKAITPHSDIDVIALVKGEADHHEILRVGERLADIRYHGYQSVEDDLAYSPRLPSLLRKGRILYDHDGICATLIEKVHQRFRQGPQPASINEQIRLKAQCYHQLGKAQDLVEKPGTAYYLLTLFYEDCISAFFRLRGFWLVSPVDIHRFMFHVNQHSQTWLGNSLQRPPSRINSTLAGNLPISSLRMFRILLGSTDRGRARHRLPLHTERISFSTCEKSRLPVQ
ncbi:MAG: nucleotidyltransferase domain-containing protein [Nitrospira sp.]|nr:nucleotidyltransferase domain-containing protein [Nitrospira sp.]